MNTSNCRVGFSSKFAVSAFLSVACALSAPVLNPTPAYAQDTAAAAVRDLPTIDSTAAVFDLRDVPVRQGLEMLLMASHSTFSIDNKVSGFITMKVGQKPLRAGLDVFCSSCSTPLEYRYENGVLFIGPKPSDIQSAPTVIPTAAAPSQPPTSAADVQRRVSGVLILKSGQAYAILETGAPDGPRTRVNVVSCGTEFTAQNPERVPSGIAGVPDLTVTGIDASGLTLASAGGGTIHVPLAGIAPSVSP